MRRVLNSSLAALAVGYAAAAVAIPQPRQEQLLSYAAVSAVAHAADVVAGVVLLIAGVTAAFAPLPLRLALVTTLSGVTWFASDWEGWSRGPEIARDLGAAAAPLLLALLFDAGVILFWRHRRPLEATVVRVVYALAALSAIGHMLFWAPYLDPHCWQDCLGNAFLVHSEPQLAQTFTDVWRWASIPIGGGLLFALAFRTPKVGRARWSAALALGGAVATEVAYAVALLYRPAEDPRSGLYSSIFCIRVAVLTLFGLMVVWVSLDAWRARARLALLAAELGRAPSPGSLESALAATVGDPTLEVAYWARSTNQYIDARGQPIEPPVKEAGRAATPILRGSEPIAIVGHDVALLDGDELAEQIGSTARLAVDNERLQAEILGQLTDLRVSRARLVETADSARRKLERNLHDGAQQRLLAVSYELRLALSGAQADGDAELAHVLATAVEEIRAVTAALRELAHGIYPAVLAEAGLGPALERLLDSAPIPVKIAALPTDRYALTTETTAYVVVADALHDAASRSASRATVTVEGADNQLLITVEDNGAPRASPLTLLSDRVGALGGRVHVKPTLVCAEIPCV